MAGSPQSLSARVSRAFLGGQGCLGAAGHGRVEDGQGRSDPAGLQGHGTSCERAEPGRCKKY